MTSHIQSCNVKENLGSKKGADTLSSIYRTLEKTFRINLEALEHFQPYLYQKFKEYKVQRGFEFVAGDDLSVNIRYLDDGSLFYSGNRPFESCRSQLDALVPRLVYDDILYSRHKDNFGQIHIRYANEAVALFDDADPLDAKVDDIHAIPHCVLLGSALGYTLGMLYERLDIASLMVIESDADLFYASLFTYNYKDLFEYVERNTGSIHFIVGKSAQESFYELFAFYNDYGYFLSCLKCVIATYINRDINEFIEKLYNRYEHINSAAGFFDDALFGISHGICCIQKDKSLARNDVTIKEEYASLPVFVIGNGPSLDNDLAFIRKNQDKALILACGSAIETLYNEGIKPDFYTVTERPDYIARTLDIFEGTDFLDDIILVSANMVHPDTTEFFNRQIIFSKENEALGFILKSHDGVKERLEKWADITHINPLVGNAGLSAAMHLGFKQIFMFGLDNGRAGDSGFHSKSSHIYNGIYKINRLERHDLKVMAKGNFGGEVESNTLYINSKLHMELLISSFENVKCINCSDGVLCEGAQAVHSSELDFRTYKDIDKEAIKNYLMDKMTFKAHLSEEEISEIFCKDKFNLLADTLINVLQRKSSSRKEQFYVFKSLSEFMGQMAVSKDALYALTINSSSQFFFALAVKALYRIKNESRALSLCHRIIRIYINFLEDSKYLFSFMPYYVENTHLKLIGHKIGLDHNGSAAPRNFEAFRLFNAKPPAKDKCFAKRYD